MKVHIGPYRDWVGPYQIAEKLMFWVEKYKDEKADDRVHEFGRWLSEDRYGNDSWLTKVCQWIDSKKKRKVEVRIDYYDTWSMDHTLSHIILPMLKQLKATKHGSPFVDDEDVPEDLRSTASPELTQEQKDCGHTDDNFHKRWEWVLDEMIWAFEQQLDDDADRAYYDEYAPDEPVELPMNYNVLNADGTTSEDTFKWDTEEHRRKRGKLNVEKMREYNNRKKKAFTLFGKYYEGLWD